MGVKLDGYCEECRYYEPEEVVLRYLDGRNVCQPKCRNSHICERAYTKGQEDDATALGIREAMEPVLNLYKITQGSIDGVKSEIKKSKLIMILQSVSIVCLALAHILS